MRQFTRPLVITGFLVTFLPCGGTLRAQCTTTTSGLLVASDATPFDGFGECFSRSGDRLLVGAPGALAGNQGQAYIFEKIGGVWQETAKLTASDGQPGDQFGYNVALDGDLAVVGALGSSPDKIYVFTRSGGTWTETAQLPPPAGGWFDLWAAVDRRTLAVNNGRILIRAAGPGIGLVVLVYEYVSSVLTVTGEIRANDSLIFEFGSSLDLEGNRALIGGTIPSGVSSGLRVAYIFQWDGLDWIQTARLDVVGNTTTGYPSSVSLSGDRDGL